MKKRILSQSYLILLLLLFICVAAHAQWQASSKGPQINYTVFSEYETAVPDTIIKLVIQFKLEPEWHINSNKPLDEFLIPTELSIENSSYIQVKEIVYPPSKQVKLSFSDEPLSVFENEFYIGIEVVLLPDAKVQNAIELTGSLRYQACNDRQCLPPTNLPIKATINIGNNPVPANDDTLKIIKSISWEQTTSAPNKKIAGTEEQYMKPETISPSAQGNWEEQIKDFQIVGRLDGYASKNDFIQFIESAEQTNTPVQSKTNHAIISLLFIILIGGLALNLTPCVLPVIPLNLAIIGAGARAGSRIRGFLLGLSYGLGISLVYGGLGIAVVLGFSRTFGTINSTYWFNGFITLLFIILALAMFDLIIIDFSRFQSYIGVRRNIKGSFGVALFMGGVSALLAGACVAPVVISTILQAQDLYSQGYKSALLLPFLLGVGMALPWPILGAGMSLLPKPGKWMEYVKYAFGVFLLCLAGYYGYTTYTLFSAGNIETEQLVEGWHTSLADGLAEAKSKNQPVIIDFWATWCKNCLVMNKTVLSDETVKEKLQKFTKIKYQAENPDSPEIQKVLEHFEVLGLPTFVILKPKENK
ncbi:MAG TPA: cytochrome c biogenesis protein CcdA [Candidatus Hydrogenedens sp.]|nr:cytochrome c biogenesis protein CcdA [Candidatus Hydrogenedens sp.]